MTTDPAGLVQVYPFDCAACGSKEETVHADDCPEVDVHRVSLGILKQCKAYDSQRAYRCRYAEGHGLTHSAKSGVGGTLYWNDTVAAGSPNDGKCPIWTAPKLNDGKMGARRYCLLDFDHEGKCDFPPSFCTSRLSETSSTFCELDYGHDGAHRNLLQGVTWPSGGALAEPGTITPFEIIDAYGLDYYLGAAVENILEAGSSGNPLEYLKAAIRLIERRIEKEGQR